MVQLCCTFHTVLLIMLEIFVLLAHSHWWLELTVEIPSLPPASLSLSLPPSLSLSQQLLQVIDDLIRMLPAAPRLTLKDFPYAMPQTANGARATRRCQRTFPNGLLVEEIKERAVLSSCPLFYAQTRNCVSSGTWKFEPFLN